MGIKVFLFLHDYRRIRIRIHQSEEAQKHVDPDLDSDPEHCHSLPLPHLVYIDVIGLTWYMLRMPRAALNRNSCPSRNITSQILMKIIQGASGIVARFLNQKQTFIKYLKITTD